MANSFDKLRTVEFQQRLKPDALRIYSDLFPGCRVQDLREDGVRVHILDKEFGIDSLITMESGQWISIQEKYRQHKYMVERSLMVEPPDPDFTQEYKNAAGTPYESPGEWFKLGAQLYFYGWSNENETGFDKWVLLDIAKYKMVVEVFGGLERMGRLKQNREHGKASFYAIPILKLSDAFVATCGFPKWQEANR